MSAIDLGYDLRFQSPDGDFLFGDKIDKPTAIEPEPEPMPAVNNTYLYLPLVTR